MLQVNGLLHSTNHADVHPVPQFCISKSAGQTLQWDATRLEVLIQTQVLQLFCMAASFRQNQPQYVWFFPDSLTTAFSCYRNSAGAYHCREGENEYFQWVYQCAHFKNLCAAGIVQYLHTRFAWPCWYCGHAPTMGRWTEWWPLYHLS